MTSLPEIEAAIKQLPEGDVTIRKTRQATC